MIADTVVLVPPTRYPISLAEAKEHCNIDVVERDAYITALIAMATTQAENLTGRSLITRTLRAAFDEWPSVYDWRADYALELPYPPIQSVTGFSYIDADGVSQTVDPDTYRTDASSGRIIFGTSQSWPTANRVQSGGIVATYLAGYGDTPASVPEPIRQWIKVRVATAYEFREAIGEKDVYGIGRSFVDALLDVYTVHSVV